MTPAQELLHQRAHRIALRDLDALGTAAETDPESLSEAEVLLAAYHDLRESRGLPGRMVCYPSIQLASGGMFDFLDPAASRYSQHDIATALAKIPRMNGHNVDPDRHYSVAQHCVQASWVAPVEYKFEALMHDSPEFVMGDCTTPLKQLMPDFKVVYKRVEADLYKRYHLPPENTPAVKEIDIKMFATERRDLMHPGDPEEIWEHLIGIDPYVFTIKPWTVAESRREWLASFDFLWPAHCRKLGVSNAHPA